MSSFGAHFADADDEAVHRGFISAERIQKYFLEWNVSRQCVTGAGGHYIPEFADGPSGAFYANELGFGRHNPEPDVLQTSRGLARKNELRRDQAVGVDNDFIGNALARSPSLVLRTKLKLLDSPRGCPGCSSCAPSARLAPEPRTIRLEGSFADWRQQWTPGSPLTSEQISVVALLQTATKTLRHALRERHSVTSLLRTAAAVVRRALKEERAALYKARKERSAGARAQMQARREETKVVKRAGRAAERSAECAARRALGVASTTRR